MDVGYLKIKIDIKSEHDDYKKRYEFKRKELKRSEIKRVFDGFKEFFKADGSFKFKENEHSIAAEYKDHDIKLDMDIYKNVDSEDFNLNGTIKTFEKNVYEFVVEGVCNKDLSLMPPDADTQERMIYDTNFYKDFIEGDIEYTFQYRIAGSKKAYISMGEMLLAM
ncbi:hypothetical protein AM493_04590 [Flavobacterium akiainvivens]|uniref:Uncharacterized protein n=1 Tax=Flavobacterium akiainvivens TaxID=1202724 RepID=A0A0M9VHB9_9FLAO|nr:hypothetical protein [Flavobacterium akiainvivens]KOS05390.1 hypothetical protein AM493_04590 [Flavobacterium akiainvivens]SFQ73751.1 hypothetical protein SAMN05444144_11932 [Flavobacterium akiainvivens]